MNKVNVRVYGIFLKEQKILALTEKYAGETLLKLPGGGLEFGEGTKECLQRELREELNLEIKNIWHFYTQEDFVASRFAENQQLLTIYYTAEIADESELALKDANIESINWIPINAENPFPLPVDQLVFELLKKGGAT